MGPQDLGQMRRTAGVLTAEFLVIVIGVLVALGVDSLIQARDDAAREAEYLAQLTVELDDLAGMVEFALGHVRQDGVYATKLVDGVSTTPLAPTDSLNLWFAEILGVAAVEPTLTGLRTMMATGDLLLVRDAGLRAELVRFDDAAAQYLSSTALLIRCCSMGSSL